MAETAQAPVYEHAAHLLRNRYGGQGRVVDVGCGFPWKAAHLLFPAAASVTCRDQSTMAALVAETFPMLHFEPIDLETPEPPREQYDVVVCADVIEHLINPDPALTFLKALCGPDGVMVLSTPEREMMNGRGCLTSPNPYHVREWTKDEFSSYLRDRGVTNLSHDLVPERQLTPWQRRLAPLLRPFGKTRVWRGCQLVVAQPAP